MLNKQEQIKETTWKKLAKALFPNKYIKPNPRSILKELNSKDQNKFLCVNFLQSTSQEEGQMFKSTFKLGENIYVIAKDKVEYTPYMIFITEQQAKTFKLDGTHISEIEGEYIFEVSKLSAEAIEDITQGLNISKEELLSYQYLVSLIEIVSSSSFDSMIISFEDKNYIYTKDDNVIIEVEQ